MGGRAPMESLVLDESAAVIELKEEDELYV